MRLDTRLLNIISLLANVHVGDQIFWKILVLGYQFIRSWRTIRRGGGGQSLCVIINGVINRVLNTSGARRVFKARGVFEAVAVKEFEVSDSGKNLSWSFMMGGFNATAPGLVEFV